MPSSSRAFVLRHTRLRVVPGLDAPAHGAPIRLHLADEVLPLWHAVQVETDDPDAPLPYWAFAWGGGLAIARYLADRPEVVAGRRVLDLGSGSGLCAIAAQRAGATEVTAVDIDRFAGAAIELNTRADGYRATIRIRDILDDPPPADIDVVIAGDTWYEGRLAERVLPWLERATHAGIDVLVGDPGRRYLPHDGLIELAIYDVRTTTELEDMDLKRARVYRLATLR